MFLKYTLLPPNLKTFVSTEVVSQNFASQESVALPVVVPLIASSAILEIKSDGKEKD